MSFGSDASSQGVPPRVTSDEVVARLDAIASVVGRPPSETLLAFDADGTLWSGDVGIDNCEALLRQNAVLPAALAMLRGEASAAGLSLVDDPTAQARILYEAYERDAYPEENAFRMMACAFAGRREDAVRAFAREVAEATDLRSRLHAEITPIVDWAMR